ncbi:hypothetical protein IIU_06080 [Bacillus cereus VD133]|uniref:Uncharacterized protein n=1 Tax=Bacillus cereus VD133 TaxID=1053233 RepID=A0A9W5PKZ1_BACCE|nr:hypothetical protein IIU_06080 [Bacillus cereus VD133]
MGVKYYYPIICFYGKYRYLSQGVGEETQPTELTDVSLGIDTGVKELAVCSDGRKFKNINKTKSVKKGRGMPS